jgi:hypothetical protein
MDDPAPAQDDLDRRNRRVRRTRNASRTRRVGTSRDTTDRPSQQTAAPPPAIPDHAAAQPDQVDLISNEEPKVDRPVIGSEADHQALWQHRSVPSHHERMQGLLVKAVVGLAVLVLAGEAVRLLIATHFDLQAYHQYVVTPVIALLTGIVGFFFGKSTKSSGTSRR